MNDVYVRGWGEFIGQKKAVDQIQVAAQAAQSRDDPLPHLLLASGLHGVGKTTLAYLAAKEMDADLTTLAGRVTSTEARIKLSDMGDGDALFIDEIHQLAQQRKGDSEWLLHLLQDGVILGPRGPEPQPRVTIIGATTDVGRLPETVVSRFPLRPTLVPYSDDEAMDIAAIHASHIMPEDSPLLYSEDLLRIARAADRNPRAIRHILCALRDLWSVKPEETHDGESYVLDQALQWVGVLEDGLTTTAARYIQVMLTEYDGKAGERAMVQRLQEPGGLTSTERMLLDRGLIAFTSSGRALTGAGIARAKELA